MERGVKISNVDNVNHPSHCEGSTSLECIDCMRVAMGRNAVLNFCLCNAFKYLWRYKNKNGEEDIKKTKWYLDYVDHNLKQDCSEPIDENTNLMYHRIKGLYDCIVKKLEKRG